MQAVDAKGKAVGTWNGTGTDFWSPPSCPHSLLHTDGEPKPYLVQLRFMAPAKGTGAITIRCLLKRGPANRGEFHYPKYDISLKEASAASSASHKWLLSAKGQSCDELCYSMSKFCDMKAMRSAPVDSASNFQAEIGRQHVCRLPILTDCSVASPAHSDAGFCWAHNSSCGKQSVCVASLVMPEGREGNPL